MSDAEAADDAAGGTWLSVVTVVRNDAEALRRTLASVAAQDPELLTSGAVEHLIVDGASTDGTCELALAWAAEHPWVRVHSAPDSGVYNAMNAGVRLARGDLLLFLNAGDDFSSTGELAAVRADWEREQFEWGRYRARFVDAERQPTRPLAPAGLDVEAFCRGEQERYHQGAVMSKDLLTALGGFDERFRIVADFDLMRRALLAGHRPWVSDRILTDFDASGLSALAWRESLAEEHQVRSGGTDAPARARSWLLWRRRTVLIGSKRGLRRAAERLLGTERVSELRSRDLAAGPTGTQENAEAADDGG